ncbi:DEAD/DEAH box helicase family protein [Paenibacillus sp. ClWae2A]|uniref:DEAD/DEAH box helicase family protein n=1 Tax=Paenibacillus sp. ClWae2A TaxID=3057177 RepID=UPI0028F50EB7|nr:DEAD/DEAH box helicase family protein [Paenibacillus sp. ClWae2A]MDT9720782.1 DEAD/DEAH box helicase family protein [Paenibacillus sp. ClWae2A]
MTANFTFLSVQAQYEMFAHACIEAERVCATSPAMSAVGSRKALELAVKWVYAADRSMQTPYKDNLQSLIHEPSFRFEVDSQTWSKLPYIIKLGNLGVHTNKNITNSEAMLALAALFEFIQWIDYCYGNQYEERVFVEQLVPTEQVHIDVRRIKETQGLLSEKESEIEKLRAQVEALSKQLTQDKVQHIEERTFTPQDISEFLTRKKYIDVDLKLLGWTLGEDAREEVKVEGMPNGENVGFVDYVLYGRDGLPLALIEAKRTSVNPLVGLQQAKLYADCLEQKYGQRPIMFNTNGFDTYVWDDQSSPQRRVSGMFSRNDLEKLTKRRTQKQPLEQIVINDKITDRYYQKEAIRAVGKHIEEGHRKALTVMATGTGKTRTASSLTDVLSRSGHVTNVLFLADRKSLVKQAKDDFKQYLPDMTLCNLLSNKDDRLARIVFSTYPTILNAIDTARSDDGQRLYTPAHFDLIIIDEAHRSIFKKYRVIFEYFDAILLGLTATPKSEVDRNTYEFFEMERDVPTYAYDYETAVEKDKVLVPYYNIEVQTKFLEKGITYDDLSPEDRNRYEDDFVDEDGELPEEIPAPALNNFIFNQNTVDRVLEDLMTRGIKVSGGDLIGKTIIFAQNKKHANYIVQRFNKLYPQYHGQLIRQITYEDTYAQSSIDEFKLADKAPYISVSVDMMDTGIDVPEVVNLVFFKRIRSKAKFWQMIGRGTRLRKDLFGEGQDKTHFMIFDYLSNFEFFRQNKEGLQGAETLSLSEFIFSKRVKLTQQLQHMDYMGEAYQALREQLIHDVWSQINALNLELISVKMQLQYIEKFKHKEAFICLSETDVFELNTNLASLVFMDDRDEYAKRFDNLLYGLMLGTFGANKQFKRNKKQLVELGQALQTKATIPQVKAKITLIKAIDTDEFWSESVILDFEKVRVELRDLIKFIVDEGSSRIIYTNLEDEILGERIGEALGAAYDFENYRLKVNRYIENNKDHLAIHKLRNNLPLTAGDYESLEHIFTGELGTASDYEREFKKTPFGLLVRKIAKLEHEAAMQAFSTFINDQSLTQAQIVFVRKLIDYIAENGYIEATSSLMKAPFDRPQSFIKLFDSTKQKQLVDLVNAVRENAVNVI